MIEIRDRFIEMWNKYFPGEDLPVVFYYTDEEGRGEPSEKADEWRCVICDLGKVRQGKSVAFDIDSVPCGGGKRYFGFTDKLRSDFEFFLSYGIPGEFKGERYKKTPELVLEAMRQQPPFKAPGKYLVFKRWDKLDTDDRPLAVIFFVEPDALSGLFSLANFDQATPHGVIAPSSAGCSAIVYYPFVEAKSDHPRAILGMMDTSARPCVPAGVLTLSVPWAKFVTMFEHMNESNLITDTWNKVRERINRRNSPTESDGG
jgi:hypothetical protein